MKNKFIQLSEVSKHYSIRGVQSAALHNITFSVKTGEKIAIVGPSGCGKTTLLRLIAGLTSPTTGIITVDGVPADVFCKNVGIGFAFQRPLLLPWRTVIENVLLPAELCHPSVSSREKSKAESLLDILHLTEFSSSYPHQLSGGMLQRVTVARAVMVGSPLLLLDEPFSALDEITRELLWPEFSSIWYSERSTVLLVTHNVREAVFLSDKVLVASNHPGNIIREIPIPLKQPRNHSYFHDTTFIQLCETVRSALPNQ